MKKIHIFITIGSSVYGFDRLVKEIDKITKKNWEIYIQIGNSSYLPNKKKYIKYLNPKDLEKEIKKADIIISHAGVGTIIDLIELKKKCVLVPRLKKYGEVVDDHQLEICKELEKEGATICYDIRDLENKIKKAKKIKQKDSKQYKKLKNNFIKFIKSIEIE